MPKLGKKYFIITAAIFLSACSSDINFSDRNDLAASRGQDNLDGVRYEQFGVARTTYTLGSLTLGESDFDEESAKDDPTIFDLKRSKSKFYAETNLFQSDNKDKSFFDEGSFNMGLDRKTKGLNLEWSLKF